MSKRTIKLPLEYSGDEIVIKLNKGIKCFAEKRENIYKIMDSNEKVYDDYEFLIFQIPKSYNLDKMTIGEVIFYRRNRLDLLYNYVDKGDFIELWFANDSRFTWVLYSLEKLNIYKVKSHKYFKDKELYLFDFYSDNRTIHNIYNIVIGILELLIFLIYNYIFFLFYKIKKVDNKLSQDTLDNFVMIGDYVIENNKTRKINKLSDSSSYRVINLNEYEYIRKEKEGKYTIHIIKEKDCNTKYKIYENKMMFYRLVKTPYFVDYYIEKDRG